MLVSMVDECLAAMHACFVVDVGSVAMHASFDG